MKLAAAAIVILTHAVGVAVVARTLGAEAQIEVGSAPVINLTLEHAPRFDGKPLPKSEALGAPPEPATKPPRPQRPVPQPPPQPQMTAVREIPQQARELATHTLHTAPVVPAMTSGQTRSSQPRSQPSPAGKPTSGLGAPSPGDAARHQQDTYAAAVIAWVERHKGRPRDQLAGTITLRFEIDRQGRLRRSEVVQQADDPRVGGRALDALRAAPPFPRPPAGTTWVRREFIVRLEYKPTGAMSSRKP